MNIFNKYDKYQFCDKATCMYRLPTPCEIRADERSLFCCLRKGRSQVNIEINIYRDFNKTIDQDTSASS